jgi:archaellum component FlaG (FlaF/FlaG flagellin family)
MRIVGICMVMSVGLLLSGCASFYLPIVPSKLSFSNSQKCDSTLEVSYMYDVLSITHNRKYYRKENRNGFKTIAVSIKNVSDTAIRISFASFKMFVNNREILPANTSLYFNNVSQLSGIYLLHGLWGPWSVTTVQDTYAGSSTKIQYLPIGLAIGLINTIVASVANTNHQKNIIANDVYGKIINPHETLYGTIVLNSWYVEALEFKHIQN